MTVDVLVAQPVPRGYLIRDDTLEVLAFDAVPREAYQPSVRVTDHPVEDGADVSDHAQIQPMSFSWVAVVTDTPWAGSPSGLVASPVDNALAFLEAAQGVVLWAVSQRRGTLTNVLLTSAAHAITPAGSVEFLLQFKQVRLAVAGAVIIPAAAVSSGASGFADPSDVAEQPTIPTALDAIQEANDLTSVAVQLGV